MKILILIILLLSFSNVSSQNIWEETFNVEGFPMSIKSPDSSSCFIIVDDSEKIKPIKIFKSDNQGANWYLLSNLIYQNHWIEERIHSLSCPDSLNLFLILREGVKNFIVKTNDGGKTYEEIRLKDVDYFRPSIAMYNKDIGVVGGGRYLTFDGWKTFETFEIDTVYGKFRLEHPQFINDSIIYSTIYDTRAIPYFYTYLLKLNIKTKKYELEFIDIIYEGIQDLCVINENLLFVCGKSNTISGGSGHDAIYKSTDGGKNWRRVLDLYSDDPKFNSKMSPFGLQSIAFKDNRTGIAVGQFGKILYTYDGGESWIYENDLHPSINQPPTMLVRYAGSIPLIADFSGFFYRMLEDNLAPKPEDIYTISGKVWEGTKGQPGIPVSIGYRVTMTDSNGYYKFTLLKKGNYIVKALNKYFDGPNPKYYYKPFDYKPLQYDIELTSDTSGFDFNAEELRTFYSAGGYITTPDSKGLADITLKIQDSTAVTDSSGMFLFPKIESKRQYDLTPFSDDYTFSPAFHTINLITGDTTGLIFTATPITSVWENSGNSASEHAPVFTISPNPAGEYIEIYINNEASLIASNKVQVFDLLGIELKDLTPTPLLRGEGLRIDISHLPAGVYFIRIGNMVEKFVKSY